MSKQFQLKDLKPIMFIQVHDTNKTPDPTFKNTPENTLSPLPEDISKTHNENQLSHAPTAVFISQEITIKKNIYKI